MFICLAALAFALAAPALAGHLAVRETARVTLSHGVLDRLNRIRIEHGLVPLTASARLSGAANRHSLEMLARGYFGHESPDGSPFWRRVMHYYGPGSVGENLLWAEPDVGAARALELWMASPEHRAEILDPRWREIGVAAIHSPAAPGFYRGRAVTVITTDFGRRG